MSKKLRVSLIALVMCVLLPLVTHADIDQDGDLNVINDPGNPSDGLAYLDLSYSFGKTKSEALANAQVTYPSARLAQPSEFEHLFDASGLQYYTGDNKGTMADLFGKDQGHVINVCRDAEVGTLLLYKLTDSIPQNASNILIYGLPDEDNYYNELSIYRDGIYISWGGYSPPDDPSHWLIGWLIVVPTLQNQSPIANAGDDQTVEQDSRDGAVIALDGSDSSDPDEGSLTYIWTWVGGTAQGITAIVTLPLGTTEVTLTVSDGQDSDSDTVRISIQDTTAPVLTVPDDKQAEQANLAGTAVDIGQASAEDICDADVEITNDAPPFFPLGQTTVTWTATDDSGNTATGTQIVTVVDTTAPALTVPEDTQAEQANLAGTAVDIGQASAEDICDADIDITNDAPVVFPLGQTTVTWTATDDSGNTATGTQIVTVMDTTAPALTVPEDTQAEQANLAGTAVDIGQASAEDICDADIDITNDAPPFFPLGQTTVTWTATDDSGNAATGTQIVTVVDTTVPVLTVPGDKQAEQANLAGTAVDIGKASAEDICDSDVEIANDAPMIFPLGQTIVTWTATDDSGNAATGTQIVTVVDTTAPTVVSVSADPETLWPANHKMVEVTISVVAEDICDAEVECAILSVTSNEETDGPGDGNTEPDWEISGSLTVNLRAERSGSGEDRVYTITVACTDDSGNESTATVEVTVPHDKGKGGKKK